jgi:membrane-bound lytic murein transglycosylase F
MTRRQSIANLAALLCLPSRATSRPVNSQYDALFARWGSRYAPWEDWRWFRAQAIAESGLHQETRGTAGEIGLMQISTAVARRYKADPYNPSENVRAGIAYDADLWNLWGMFAPIPFALNPDRRSLMLASYNAGAPTIHRAARAARSLAWSEIEHTLPLVAGRRSAAITIAYVRRIHRLMGAD